MDNRPMLESRFIGEGNESTLFLPDLTLWYAYHRQHGTLPAKWHDYSLPEVAWALGAPAWVPARPWRVEYQDASVRTVEENGQRVVIAETRLGLLQSRWAVGPDGDWWQIEYPVKGPDDLSTALALAEARTYVLDASQLELLTRQVGAKGVVALEAPRRPFSDLLHEFLGWADGLLLLADQPQMVKQIVTTLEQKLQSFVCELARLPGNIVLSPDNLDGQYISPRVFSRYLAESYATSTQVLHAAGKALVVHVGGPARRLIAPLAAASVDAIEGIAPPPQGDTTLTQARELAGTDVTLWGGIPQDSLMPSSDTAAFEALAAEAIEQARGDHRMIVGIADRVPVDADISRLVALARLVGSR